MAKKRCIICGTWYTPHPRTAKTQKACSNPDCRKARKQRYDQHWRRNNPDWSAGRRCKVRAWSAEYPDYWRQYRAGNPEYRTRERERMRKNRALRVAKQVMIRQNPVGYLSEMRRSGSKTVAKQVAIAERLDGVLDYLTVCARVAKPNNIGPGPAG